MELVVHIEAEQREERHLVLNDDRHRRRQQIGAVVADCQIDLVDIEELGIDARHQRRIDHRERRRQRNEARTGDPAGALRRQHGDDQNSQLLAERQIDAKRLRDK